MTNSNYTSTAKKGLNTNTAYGYYTYLADTRDIVHKSDEELYYKFHDMYLHDGLARKTIDKPIQDAYNHKLVIKNNQDDLNKSLDWLKDFTKTALTKAHVFGGVMILKYKEGADYSQEITDPTYLVSITKNHIHRNAALGLVFQDYKIRNLPNFVKDASASNNGIIDKSNYYIVKGDENLTDVFGTSFFRKSYSAFKIVSQIQMNIAKATSFNNAILMGVKNLNKATIAKDAINQLDNLYNFYMSTSIIPFDTVNQTLDLQTASLTGYPDVLDLAIRQIAGVMYMPMQILMESNTDKNMNNTGGMDIPNYEKLYNRYLKDKIVPLLKNCVSLLGYENSEIVIEDRYSYQKKDDISILNSLVGVLQQISNNGDVANPDKEFLDKVKSSAERVIDGLII